MSRTTTILIIVAVLGIAGYVSYSQFGKWYGIRTDADLEQEQ